MKRILIISAALILIAGAAVIAFAGHSEMIVPWENLVTAKSTMMPIPEAGDVRQHILGQEPYKNWQMWPGKGEMYEGKEPHGALLTTYVNDIALASIGKSGGMSNNSIIVKENNAPNKKLVAISVMYKVKGYNPEGGDWFYAQYDSDFNVLSEGKVKGCMDCHGTAKSNDYIFTGKVR